LRTRSRLAVLVLLLSFFGVAQQAAPAPQAPPLPAQAVEARRQASASPAYAPLPQDVGQAGLQQELRRLRTTARLMQITAHPDDEDGGMLTLQARGRGVETVLFSLTRGEGGQNRLGAGLFDELGVLRTLELLAADRYYGVQQRFSRLADFGYSKSAEETFQKWGRDTALADVVRQVRIFKPDVIVARFSGTEADGHGHHQASAILAREAFRAAGDPKAFPEQLKDGLTVWQAKKLYTSAVPRESGEHTVALDKGVEDPLLGMSYQQFAMQGLRHQLSQGAGTWNLPPGPYISRYKLVDSVLTPRIEPGLREEDLFDGIDTSLPAVVARLGAEASRVPQLSSLLQLADSRIAGVSQEADMERKTIALLEAQETIARAVKASAAASLRPETKSWLLAVLRSKLNQLERAAAIAAGIDIETAVEPQNAHSAGAGLVTPGQTFRVTLRATRDPRVQAGIFHFEIERPENWPVPRLIRSSDEGHTYEVTVPIGAEYTRPYYHRDDPARDSVYRIYDDRYLGLPQSPAPLRARVVYRVGRFQGGYSEDIGASFTGESGASRKRPVAVVPPLSVLLEAPTRFVPLSRVEPTEMFVTVRSQVPQLRNAEVRLEAPAGWRIEPKAQRVSLDGIGTERKYKFYVFREGAPAGIAPLRAAVHYEGNDYDQGFAIVARDDLATGYYYHPATGRITAVDVKVPQNLTVGYVMGAGDEIPSALRDAGVHLKIISPEELATGDLSRYSTVVLGIRAYDVREDVVRHHRRLLEYVRQGGTLLVQYNADRSEFNSGKFTPYEASLGRDRVSVEDAPVTMLNPKNDEFDYPNAITSADFDGWVQERGLYFMQSWDDGRYEPLIESHDPGEPERKGGLLKATFGKGTYIYCGYAFFRQLPNGVPGALRFFVNLLSAPNEWKR